jgi:hypothetical protein
MCGSGEVLQSLLAAATNQKAPKATEKDLAYIGLTVVGSNFAAHRNGLLTSLCRLILLQRRDYRGVVMRLSAPFF